MPAYDSSGYAPPAPVAMVRIENPANGMSADDVPMLIDSGADVSLLPRSAILPLLDNASGLPTYDLIGFDGNKSSAEAVQVRLRFLGKNFGGQFLLIDQPHGILGRNILNNVKLELDGPALSWREA